MMQRRGVQPPPPIQPPVANHEDLETLRGKLQAQAIHIGTIRKELDTTTQELAHLKDINHTLSQTSLLETIARQRFQIEKAKASIKKLGEFLAEQKNTVTRLHSEQFARHESIKQLSQLNQQLQQLVTMLEETVEQQAEQIKHHEISAATLSQQLTTEKAKTKALEERDAGQQKTIQTLTGDRKQTEKSLLEQIAQLQKQLQEKTEHTETQATQITDLKSKITTLEKTATANDKRILDLNLSSVKKNKELDDVGLQFSTSQFQLLNAQEEIKQLKKLLDLSEYLFPDSSEDQVTITDRRLESQTVQVHGTGENDDEFLIVSNVTSGQTSPIPSPTTDKNQMGDPS